MSINIDVTKPLATQASADQMSNAGRLVEFANAKAKEVQVTRETADTNFREDSNKDAYQALESNRSVEQSDVEEVNMTVRQLNVGVTFELTEDGDEQVVKVIDQESGDLVRQIPSEEFLEIAKRLDEIFGELSDLKGTLVNSVI
ncbi:flagellar protein FlaG [Marinomonas communis]|uniref:flagellar protein FlaG n=1 Tax=Marinomonas communis TaxID=28254 RepID=UPI001D1820AF|nr:flagellar protein FlaG [Marinomonas communis]MCC4274499.1 flagellar protein FlaG [Marinomonas communis]